MSLRHTAIVAAAVAALTLTGVAIGANLGGHRQSPYTRANAYAMPMMAAYAATPAASTRHSHHFRGRVTSANQAHHWFWMRTLSAQHVQIYTNRYTDWGDCDWGYMRLGHRVDVRAYRGHHHWIAARMQSWNDDWMMH